MDEGKGGCPDCGGAVWRLGDGRNKCRCCGRRYTPQRRLRIRGEVRRRLALCFWQMVPCRQAAAVVHLNRKTVQHYYRVLRQGIGGEEPPPSGAPAASGAGGTRGALAGLALEGGMLRVVRQEGDSEGTPGALVYRRPGGRDRPRALSDLQLWVADGGLTAEAFVSFWTFAGRLATMTRGQHLRDVPLFFREVAYRVNQRENPRVIDDLCRLIDGQDF